MTRACNLVIATLSTFQLRALVICLWTFYVLDFLLVWRSYWHRKICQIWSRFFCKIQTHLAINCSVKLLSLMNHHCIGRKSLLLSYNFENLWLTAPAAESTLLLVKLNGGSFPYTIYLESNIKKFLSTIILILIKF